VRLKEEFIRAEEQHAMKRDKSEVEKENRAEARQQEMNDQVGR
jgi:hypothetical protein